MFKPKKKKKTCQFTSVGSYFHKQTVDPDQAAFIRADLPGSALFAKGAKGISEVKG